ncbi:DUF4129 domain-containing protein [Microbacterium sp. ZW T5_56]|uniref:DUF4129 domain-containing protein n=1 Tax=Microbacterium sp. ZW T5_56 TaxID=3378081 RepID=UPI0038541D5E
MRSPRETQDPARSRLLGLPGVVTVTAIIVFVALVSTVQGVPRVDPPDFGAVSPPPITPPPAASAAPGEMPTPPPVDPAASSAIQVVLALLLAAVLVLLGIWVTRHLIRWLRERRVHARAGVSLTEGIAGVAAPEPDAQVIRRGIAAALAEMDADREPADAIVAAWVGLEESAADAGLRREPTETAGEFVVRIIARDQRATADVGTLLRLYEDVRFGGRSVDDAELRLARAALRRIETVWS